MRYLIVVTMLACTDTESKLKESDSTAPTTGTTPTVDGLCQYGEAGATGTAPTGAMNTSPFTCEDDTCARLSFSHPTPPDNAAGVCWAFSDGQEASTVQRVEAEPTWERAAPQPSFEMGTLGVLTRFLDANGDEVATNAYDVQYHDVNSDDVVPPPAIYATLFSRGGCSVSSLTVRQIGTCYSLGANLTVSVGTVTLSSFNAGEATQLFSKNGTSIGWEITIPNPTGALKVTKTYLDGSTSAICSSGDVTCFQSETPTEIPMSSCAP